MHRITDINLLYSYMKRRYLLCLLMVILLVKAYGVVPSFQLLSPLALPSSKELRCLYFDHRGLMWLGTSNGLMSYDGYTMHTFRSGGRYSSQLPSIYIRCLTEDQRHNMWIGTDNGLVRMSLYTGDIKHYLGSTTVYSLFTSRDGTVWVCTDDGIGYYDVARDQVKMYKAGSLTFVYSDGRRGKNPRFNAKSMIEDRQGNLFIGTWSHSLLRFDRRHKIIYQTVPFNEKGSAYSLCMDRRGHLWVGTWGYGLVRLNRPYDCQHPDVLQFPYGSYNFSIINHVAEDPVSGTVWASSHEGVGVAAVDTRTPSWNTYTSIGGQPLAFAQFMVTDGMGHLWLGTLNRGVVQLDTRRPLFPQTDLSEAFAYRPLMNVNMLYTDDGRHLFVSMLPNGLALQDLLTGKVVTDRNIPGLSDLPASFFNSETTSFARRFNGELWIGSWAGVVIVRDGKGMLLDKDRMDYLNDNSVTALHQAEDGCMWIGQRRGLSVLDANGHGRLLHPIVNNRRLDFPYVHAISEDRSGNIWVSTGSQGILRVSKEKGQYRFRQYISSSGNFSGYGAFNCMEDRQGRLWAISGTDGLFLYNASTDRFECKNPDYHLPSYHILSIKEDGQGNLWLTTDGEIIRLSLSGDSARSVSFGRSEGLSDINFNINTTVRWKDRLFFNTDKGYFIVDTRHIKLPRHAPHQVVVTNLYVDRQPFELIDSTLRSKITDIRPSYARRLTIPAGIKRFDVEFSLLSYANPDRNQYAYKVEGYDDRWIYCEAGEHKAVLQNLPPGKYRLMVRACDDLGQWVSMEPIELQVLSPWYATWWAILCWALLIVCLIVFVIHRYHAHLKLRNRLQMQELFTNLTHELITPLSVILAIVDQLRSKAPEQEKEYQLMEGNVNRLTFLLRQILEVRKSQAGQLRLLVARGNISDSVRHLCDHLSPLAHSRGITFTIDLPECRQTVWFDSDKLDKIVYNLLSNAFKYTSEGGSVSCRLRLLGKEAELTISDTGMGMSREQQKHLYQRFFDGAYRKAGTQGTGIGLSLVNDLVRLHHGTIHCKSSEGIGTTFTVTIPIVRSAYGPEEIDNKEVVPLSDGESTAVKDSAVDNTAADNLETDNFHILIVEDNVQLLASMTEALSRHYHVRKAHDGLQALNIIHRYPLDVVVSDVMMPVMDGWELTRTLKQDPEYNQLPIILLTALTQEDNRDQAYRAGADDYLQKPFPMHSLILRIDNIITNRRRLRERFESQLETFVRTPATKSESAACSSPDQVFLQKAVSLVKAHLADADYDREAFASDMLMSGSSLYNKLRALTGKNIVGFISSIRLAEARRILEQTPDISVNELSLQVGFNTPKYFSRCFKREFGVLPSEYAGKHHDTSVDGSSTDDDAV